MFTPKIVKNLMGMIAKQKLQEWKRQDPELFGKAVEFCRGKSDGELMKIAEGMAKERGINLRELAETLGLKI